MKKINVLVVDDSAVARQVVTQILSQDSAINVLGAAQDPLFAMERMKKAWPDVLVLDIEMPRMDGITFLRKIMEERPTPVVICSTLTEKGAKASIDAMAAGAVGIVTKARSGLSRFLAEHAAELTGAVKAAAQANVARLRSRSAPLEAVPKAERKLSADAILARAAGHATLETTERVVAIGTSTGGTLALEEVLVRLGQMSPGIVVVQHMPERFTAAFAERLNSLCRIEVREARNGDRVLPGLALIAPGGRHMLLKTCGARYQVEVVDGPVVNRHRPSVDVLFRSVAKYAGKNALGIIMTGMGDDGAAGLLEMRQAGAQTIAQDEATCVVYGMPKEAVKRGGAMSVLPLGALPEEISRFGGGFM